MFSVTTNFLSQLQHASINLCAETAVMLVSHRVFYQTSAAVN